MTEEFGSPRVILERHGLTPKRSFGQNFLSDANMARRIAELSTTPPGGTVVEIGAGLGALTRPLLERASRVVAIERDRDLVPALGIEFEAAIQDGRLELLEADAKQVDYAALLGDGAGPRVVAGNLPYQLTGPLLELTVAFAHAIDRAVYMVQLEVAERLTAAPSTSAYGALTVFINAAFTVERAVVVRRGAFYPQPNVDSAVVVLTPRKARGHRRDADLPRRRQRRRSDRRRKTLRNAWRRICPASTPP